MTALLAMFLSEFSGVDFPVSTDNGSGMPRYKVARVRTVVDTADIEATNEDEARQLVRSDQLEWSRSAERTAYEINPSRGGRNPR